MPREPPQTDTLFAQYLAAFVEQARMVASTLVEGLN